LKIFVEIERGEGEEEIDVKHNKFSAPTRWRRRRKPAGRASGHPSSSPALRFLEGRELLSLS